MVRFAAVLVGVAACGSGTVVIAPVIDSPPTGSDAAAFPDLDVVELAVAVEGDDDDLVSATFRRGEPLELADVPYGEALVIHMIGRVGGSEVAAGRTCAFSLRTDEPPPAPHLYFARTVKWADAVAPANPIRVGGVAITYDGDGSGLFLGGTDANDLPIAGLDRFDPMVGAFVPIGDLRRRRGAVAAQLAGPVVIAGGTDAATGQPATYVELVHPDRIDPVDAPPLALTELAIAALSDGRAVAFGGRDAAMTVSASVVEVAPDGAGVAVRTLDALLAMPRAGHTATRLSDDLGAPVLIAGGDDAAGVPVAIAELYKPLREDFADPVDFAPAMVVPRTGHQAIRLPDGSVLVVGGYDVNELPVTTLELFSIDTGFVDVGVLPATAGINAATLTPLPDGRVLLAGGLDVAGAPVDTAFIVRLDPIDGVVDLAATDRLAAPRAGHQATLLCDGTVMLVGGTATPSPSERYNPPAQGRR